MAVILLLAVSCGSHVGKSRTVRPVDLHTELGSKIAIGFNITSPELVHSAAAAGMTATILYGKPPSPGSKFGSALKSSHMRVISGEVALLVEKLECFRTHTVAPPPQGAASYCSIAVSYSDENLLEDVRKIAVRDSQNSLVSGYWILDDVAGWDAGGLHDILQKVREILPQNRPSLCGFSAEVTPEATEEVGWDQRRAANYSSEACDAVAPYIYAAPADTRTAGMPRDWSMAATLPAVRESLRDNGWDQKQTPLIGIGQAWSGQRQNSVTAQYAPSVSDMLTQARAFHEAGAIGLGWYAWSLSHYPDARTPGNDAQMSRAISISIRDFL